MAQGKEAREETCDPIIICICGLAGSGKSTAARKLAEKYGIKYLSGGDALKALAMGKGYKTIKHGWWERKEGMRFLEERSRDEKFDERIDKKLIELSQRGNVILDSWTMPWLLEKGFKIWLEASPEHRAKRIAKRDGMSVKEALNALRSKEKKTKAIYKRLYGFELGEDYKPFHLILDTDHLRSKEVFQVLSEVIDNVYLQPKKC